MEGSFWDFGTVRQFCWQTCDEDSSSYPVEFSGLPKYLDAETREQFVNTAAFFGCVDNCEFEEHDQKLMLILIPAAVGLLLLVVLVLCCWCNSGCPLRKYCAQRRKNRMLASSSPSNPSSGVSSLNSTTSAISHRFKTPNIPFLMTQSSYVSQITVPQSASTVQSKGRNHLKKPVLPEDIVELDASIRSNVSVNSWIQESKKRSHRRGDKDPQHSKEARKRGLLETATRLGKKLVDMDKGIEHRQRRRRREMQLAKEEEERRRKGHKHGKSSSSSSTSSSSSKSHSTSSQGILQPRMRF